MVGCDKEGLLERTMPPRDVEIELLDHFIDGLLGATDEGFSEFTEVKPGGPLNGLLDVDAEPAEVLGGLLNIFMVDNVVT